LATVNAAVLLVGLSGILSHAAGNTGPGPAYGNTQGVEYGDAVYRYLNKWGYNYNHTGLFCGIDSGGNLRVLESTGENGDSTKENSLYSSFLNQSGAEYYGAYTLDTYTTTAPFSDRKTVVDWGKRLMDAYIYYPSGAADAIEWKGSSFDGTVEDIYAIRCDGLVEYAYEKAGKRVWGNCVDGRWNIVTEVDYTGGHNSMPDNTRDPDTELSPWAQRGAPPATGPYVILFGEYSGPPWPDTRMVRPSVITYPVLLSAALVNAATPQRALRVKASDESGIWRIEWLDPGSATWESAPNPDRYPTTDYLYADIPVHSS